MVLGVIEWLLWIMCFGFDFWFSHINISSFCFTENNNNKNSNKLSATVLSLGHEMSQKEVRRSRQSFHITTSSLLSHFVLSPNSITFSEEERVTCHGSKRTGCLPFTQKIRKFRMECKWEDYFFLPERKFPGENEISWKVVQNSQTEFPNGKCAFHFNTN